MRRVRRVGSGSRKSRVSTPSPPEPSTPSSDDEDYDEPLVGKPYESPVLERRKVIFTPPFPPKYLPPKVTPEGVAGPSRRRTGMTPSDYDSDDIPEPSPKSPMFPPARRIIKRGRKITPVRSITPADPRTVPSPYVRRSSRLLPHYGTSKRDPPELVPKRVFHGSDCFDDPPHSSTSLTSSLEESLQEEDDTPDSVAGPSRRPAVKFSPALRTKRRGRRAAAANSFKTPMDLRIPPTPYTLSPKTQSPRKVLEEATPWRQQEMSPKKLFHRSGSLGESSSLGSSSEIGSSTQRRTSSDERSPVNVTPATPSSADDDQEQDPHFDD